MLEQLSDRAQRVMVLAKEESRLLGHPHIGTEHLLLGIARLGGGPVGTVLEGHGLTMPALRWQLTPGAGAHGTDPVPLTRGAARVLERAVHAARHLGLPEVEPELLLLALTSAPPPDSPDAYNAPSNAPAAPGVSALWDATGVDPSALYAELLARTGYDAPGGQRARVNTPDGVRRDPSAALGEWSLLGVTLVALLRLQRLLRRWHQ